MDVVKTNVEKIGGTLDLQSVPGRGTTLRIKIPLTLAIVPALIVTCDKERYAIPQVSLLELVRLEGQRARQVIEQIHDVPVYRLRGNLLPLVYLNEQLNLAPAKPVSELDDSDVINIVVLQAEDRQFGLIVDKINDTQEIVVKPLGKHLKSISAYAGATIMGDGTVALILDVLGIAQQSKILAEHHERAMSESKASRMMSNVTESLLLVDPGDGGRVAIPLKSVARLEEFDANSLESVDYKPVVQYRGEIMPLISLDGSGMAGSDGMSLSVVVYQHEDRNVGVIVGNILDIVDEPFDGEYGERIIANRVTRVIDLTTLVTNHLPSTEFACV